MRGMRRTDREVTDPKELQAILDQCQVLRVGGQDEEGMFIVPVNFGYDLKDGKLTLYFHSAYQGRKADAFQKGGSVAFEMDCGFELKPAPAACGFSCAYSSIMGSGTIRMVLDPEEKVYGLNRVMAQLTGREWDMPAEAVERTAVFAIEAGHWTGKANRKD